jgi:hypothetical protein
MKPGLAPGEFLDKKGRKHEVEKALYIDRVHRGGNDYTSTIVVPSHPDFPAALAALTALAQEPEWVEYAEYCRCNESMTRFQESWSTEPRWRDSNPDERTREQAEAYFRGRVAGLAQGRKENEGLQESRVAVMDGDGWATRMGYSCNYQVPYEQWTRIVALAKAVRQP